MVIKKKRAAQKTRFLQSVGLKGLFHIPKMSLMVTKKPCRTKNAFYAVCWSQGLVSLFSKMVLSNKKTVPHKKRVLCSLLVSRACFTFSVLGGQSQKKFFFVFKRFTITINITTTCVCYQQWKKRVRFWKKTKNLLFLRMAKWLNGNSSDFAKYLVSTLKTYFRTLFQIYSNKNNN